MKRALALALVALAAPAVADEDDPKPPSIAPPPTGKPAEVDPMLDAPTTPVAPVVPPTPATPPPTARPGHPVTTVRLGDGTSLTGEIVGMNARWVVLDTGAKIVTLSRADVVSLGDGVPPAIHPVVDPYSPALPSVAIRRPAGPPRDRIRQGAFFYFGLTPRYLSLEGCSYSIGTDCISTINQSGYAISGSVELGFAFRKKYLISILTALGGASASGTNTLIWDEFLIGRAMISGGFFVEAGAGVALTNSHFGFGGRLGFGYEVKVARNFVFAPALTATGMIGPAATGRITVDGQIGARYYF